MAEAFDGDLEPLIITKKKKIPAPAHGGAWKVAYADFVTAMMAFFLLLWLLASVTEDAMGGIADYFTPTTANSEGDGVGKALGGLALAVEGAMKSASSRPSVSVSVPTFGEEEEGELDGEIREDVEASSVDTVKQKQLEKETEVLAQAKAKILQSIEESDVLQDLQDSLLIEETPEGLRIQILDQEKRPMFKEDSPELSRYAQRLLALIGSLIVQLPNKVTITGHSETSDFKKGPVYGLWELSADRATESRKWLVDAGLPNKRVVQVLGSGDNDPVDVRNPSSVRNRRISILLLRDIPLDSLN